MVTTMQLMKRNLVKIPASASAFEAAKVMRERGIGSVFVEQHARIIGIVTETDITRKIVGERRSPEEVLATDIMSSPVIGIDDRRPVTEAADLMDRHHTRHLAVFAQGRIVGVLSVRDLLQPVAIDEL